MNELIVSELAAVLMEYEKLEAEIIFDDDCWWSPVRFPQHYFDRLVELQYKRNSALERAGYSAEMRAQSTTKERNQ